MKKLVLATAAFLFLAAVPAMAYVQPGSLNQNAKLGATTTKSHRGTQEMDGGAAQGGGGVSSERLGGSISTDPLGETPLQEGDTPTRPVPEPGTMAMASMGLLAIGAALRHKRGH